MPDYSAFGLTVRSVLDLPGVPAGRGDPDTFVAFGPVEPDPEAVVLDDRRRVASDGKKATMYWDGFGAVRIVDGREIRVDRVAGVDDGFYRQVVQNIAFGVILHQRGIFTLHGSAVALPGGAVGLVGCKGAGKSTAAGSLLAAGHDLVADDLLAVDLSSNPPAIQPGIPNVKLWPESLHALGEDPTALPALFEATEKRIHDRTDRFVDAPQPLRRIYVLAFAGEEPRIEPLPPRAALIELIQHSYALRFLGNRGATSAHFEQARRLARRGIVARLSRPRSLDALAEVTRMIEQDLAALPATIPPLPSEVHV
jgi:hypothetical protein